MKRKELVASIWEVREWATKVNCTDGGPGPHTRRVLEEGAKNIYIAAPYDKEIE